MYFWLQIWLHFGYLSICVKFQGRIYIYIYIYGKLYILSGILTTIVGPMVFFKKYFIHPSRVPESHPGNQGSDVILLKVSWWNPSKSESPKPDLQQQRFSVAPAILSKLPAAKRAEFGRSRSKRQVSKHRNTAWLQVFKGNFLRWRA